MNLRRVPLAVGDVWRLMRLHTRLSLQGVEDVAARGPGPGGSGIVVSLTTVPSRIERILPALNSLLDQTVIPDRIFLALPSLSKREQTGYVVPEELHGHPRVTVLPSSRDWGPATKFIPALLQLADTPDAAILAVDDDNVYPRTFVETFRRFATLLPDAALSLRGCAVPPSLRWRDCREYPGTAITSPARTDIVEGCGGILVRPRFFDAHLLDYAAAPPEAFFVDDVWVSGHLARRGIPRYVVPFSGAFIYLPSLATFSGSALDRDVNRSGRNNDILMEHFSADWRRA